MAEHRWTFPARLRARAFDYAMRAAEHAGQRDGALKAMTQLVEPERGNEAWARGVLRRKVEAARRGPRG